MNQIIQIHLFQILNQGDIFWVLKITLKNKKVRHYYTLSIKDFEKKVDELAENVRLEYEEQMEISSDDIGNY